MQAFDPLDYGNLAKSVVQALLDGPEVPLPLDETFDGVGVYAIYYRGDFPAYSSLAEIDPFPPIYVGKASPSGARKGTRQQQRRRELYQRLNQHVKSIDQTENLRVVDFTCRYLVVVPVWITLAERFLVEHYKPVWNVIVDGFGNHDPGAGRRAMKRPQWDILHPGRPWAARLGSEESFEEILQKVQDFLGKKD